MARSRAGRRRAAGRDVCPRAPGPRPCLSQGLQGGEAAWLGSDIEILAAGNLLALINHFNGAQVLSPPAARLVEQAPHYPELTDIKGQETTIVPAMPLQDEIDDICARITKSLSPAPIGSARVRRLSD